MNANKKTVSKMSDLVIECELRGAWADVERDLRHGVESSRATADYVAALSAEKARRARG